jgi:hypothetical protein
MNFSHISLLLPFFRDDDPYVCLGVFVVMDKENDDDDSDVVDVGASIFNVISRYHHKSS